MLNDDETREALRVARAAAADTRVLIAGVAHESLTETLKRIEHAASAGYDVALVRTPHFFRPQLLAPDHPAAMLNYYRMVADASPLPVLLYSIPSYTGYDLPVELVAELAGYREGGCVPASEKDTAAVTEHEMRGAPVICIPAGDQADELTAMALAQLLEQSCYNTLLLPVASVSDEILDRLAQDPSSILCISALPPFVFTQTRALCQRIRERMPENRVLACLWLSPQDPDTVRERFGNARPDRVVTKLAAALEQISAWQLGTPEATPEPGTLAAEPLTAE